MKRNWRTIIVICLWWRWNQCWPPVLRSLHFSACSTACKWCAKQRKRNAFVAISFETNRNKNIISPSQIKHSQTRIFFSLSICRFDGRIVARLPFLPISWIQGLSHRNLPGDDYTECSFIFLYILCTMSIRQNIQKLLGFAPSRAASKQSGLFGAAPGQFK